MAQAISSFASQTETHRRFRGKMVFYYLSEHRSHCQTPAQVQELTSTPQIYTNISSHKSRMVCWGRDGWERVARVAEFHDDQSCRFSFQKFLWIPASSLSRNIQDLSKFWNQDYDFKHRWWIHVLFFSGCGLSSQEMWVDRAKNNIAGFML